HGLLPIQSLPPCADAAGSVRRLRDAPGEGGLGAASEGYTVLFEALVVSLVRASPVAAVARLVREHDTAIWRIVHHYVDQARAIADHSQVKRVGMDETASRRGQRYVSLFVDMDRRRVLFATPGKSAATVAAFAADLNQHGGDANAVKEVSMDMSRAFQTGAAESLPEAAVTFDKFHAVSLVNAAVDEVRREEAKRRPELKGTRRLWLFNPEKLKESAAMSAPAYARTPDTQTPLHAQNPGGHPPVRPPNPACIPLPSTAAPGPAPLASTERR
ncbi:MAG: ISL3 family transposase, partial [Acidobacteria bacterium]|nr:ISL3 family transposase [Acidobacteriota bacterium]